MNEQILNKLKEHNYLIEIYYKNKILYIKTPKKLIGGTNFTENVSKITINKHKICVDGMNSEVLEPSIIRPTIYQQILNICAEFNYNINLIKLSYKYKNLIHFLKKNIRLRLTEEEKQTENTLFEETFIGEPEL